MSEKKKQANQDLDLDWLEEDPLGLNEEMPVVAFECLDCGKEDEVPDFVVEEFGYDLKKGEEVEIECPFCGGTMKQARKNSR
ncbi:hypothetical protein NIE88_16555 [Sporolactobacillus shoreicorticis]|uniref:DPH-type MB domain-containing protein n=1 Tax=Sporolactobacillus shoreicorticis TaxID=1923877 RepID=A0ABW5S531_9BACL|nr:hypothetical protein [Sporolactobacillus shoreicorticis]MCO7127381.1 hypothetical protein [Sporolactobacillus shoreicorticis]